MNRAPKTILVEPSIFHTLNLGDMAMLVAATRRLREVFPDARILVFTDAPDRLRRFCPDAEPVSAEVRRQWFYESVFVGRLRAVLPHGVDAGIRLRPRLGAAILSAKRLVRRQPREPVRAFRDAVVGCDLLVVCGMGAISDLSPPLNGPLGMAEILQARGVPTVFMGQGLGPLERPDLQEQAARVLPEARLVALREPVGGQALCAQLGVDAARVRVTGDDATGIVLGRHGERGPVGGTRIGLNVRVAGYTGVTQAVADDLARVVEQEAAARGTTEATVAISYVPGEEDAGAAADAPLDLGVLDEIAECAAVVVCSYHAAVFALAQGVPVVGLSASAYYDWKFRGLAALYPGGITTVDLRDDGWPSQLPAALRTAVETDAATREALVKSAGRQRDAGRAAYDSVAAVRSQ
ncbi:MAG: polysaccharide pyruvyl transferase family protein [Gaiellaceae bacterium]